MFSINRDEIDKLAAEVKAASDAKRVQMDAEHAQKAREHLSANFCSMKKKLIDFVADPNAICTSLAGGSYNMDSPLGYAIQDLLMEELTKAKFFPEACSNGGVYVYKTRESLHGKSASKRRRGE